MWHVLFLHSSHSDSIVFAASSARLVVDKIGSAAASDDRSVHFRLQHRTLPSS